MLRTIVEGEPEFESKLRALAARTGTIPESVESGARAIVAERAVGGNSGMMPLAPTHGFADTQIMP